MQICGVESWEFTYKLFAAYNNSVHGIHDKNLIIIVINHEYHEISGTPDRDTKIKFYKWFEDPVTTYLHSAIPIMEYHAPWPNRQTCILEKKIVSKYAKDHEHKRSNRVPVQ